MEEITILDHSFTKVGDPIDVYLSFIWTERYAERGDFVLELPLHQQNNPYLVPGNFLVVKSSSRVMIIGDLNPKKDLESGSKLVITGYSGEDILSFRAITSILTISGPLQPHVRKLIEDNFITPTNVKRALPGFSYTTPTDYVVLTETLSNQYEIDTVYEVMKLICDAVGMGFAVYLKQPDRTLAFLLYSGKDRSYEQTTNPYVIFSDNVDNVTSSNFYISNQGRKNVVYVVTTETIPSLNIVSVSSDPEPSGWDRLETVVKETISRKVKDSPDLTDQEVLGIAVQKGLDKLYELRPIAFLDGEVDTTVMFKYGQDFFMGDIVQCTFDGRDTIARITELVRSTTEEGTKTFVSFDFTI